MHDLTFEEIRAYGAAVGLEVDPEEIAEVTHRINALRDELVKLDALVLRSVVMCPPIFMDGCDDAS